MLGGGSQGLEVLGDLLRLQSEENGRARNKNPVLPTTLCATMSPEKFHYYEILVIDKCR